MHSNGVARRSMSNHESSEGKRTPPVALSRETIKPEDLETSTPEQDQHVHQKRSIALSNAPSKQKLQQKPLVKTKLSRSDIRNESDDSVVKAPSNLATINKAEKNTSINGSQKEANGSHFNGAGPSVKNGCGSITQFTTVTLPKGIEMKRTNAVHKFKVATSSSSCSMVGGRLRDEVSGNPCKMTKSKTRPVRTSVTVHHIPQKYSNVQENSGLKKSSTVAIAKSISENKVSDPEIKQDAEPLQPLIPASFSANKDNDVETRNTEPPVQNVSHEKAVGNVSNEKPIENVSHEKPVKKYFKSKFWEYLDPKRKPGPREHRVEKDKARQSDPREIKSFMEKQREIRQMTEKREEEERQKAAERKKRQLEELDQKCRGIVSKPSAVKNGPTCAFILTDKQPVKQFRSNPSVSPIKTKKQPLEINLNMDNATPADGGSTKEKISDLRASTVLRNFQNDLKSDCFTILKVRKTRKSDSVTTVDGGVGSSMNSFNNHYSEGVQFGSDSSDKVSHFSKNNTKVDFQKEVNILLMKNKAATKIQAAYKGYRIRKLRKEGKLTQGMFHHSAVKRRWSFYKPPKSSLSASSEKSARRLPVDRNSTQWDFAYIPPPSSSFFSSDSPKPISVPFTASPHGTGELSRFNEPFPKEALRRLSAIHNSPRPKSFYERRHSDTSFNIPSNSFKTKVDIDVTDSPLSSVKRYDDVDIPVPRFSTVLKEKVRLLEEKTATMIMSQERKNRSSHQKRELDKSFDSDSTEHASVLLDSDNTISNTITEEYIGPDEKKMKEAYVLRTSPRSLDPSSLRRSSKNFHRKRLSLSFSPRSRSGSTTTVETDVELLSNGGQESQTQIDDDGNTPLTKTGPEVGNSSVGIENYPTPAVKLQFEAEKERLHILDQALKSTMATVQAQDQLMWQQASNQSRQAETEQEVLNSRISGGQKNSQDYIIEIAKCQADCLKATAEVTKWMTELRKSEKEREHIQRDQETVNMAAVVFAAVEEAKRLSLKRYELENKYKAKYQSQADEMTQFPSEKSEAKMANIETETYPPPASSSKYVMAEKPTLVSSDLPNDVQNQTTFIENLDDSDIPSKSFTDDYNTYELDFEEDEFDKNEELNQIKADDVHLFDTKAENRSPMKATLPSPPSSTPHVIAESPALELGDLPKVVQEHADVTEKLSISDVSSQFLSQDHNANEFNLEEPQFEKSEVVNQFEDEKVPSSDTEPESQSVVKPYSPPSSPPSIVATQPASISADLPEDVHEEIISNQKLKDSDISLEPVTESYSSNELNFEEDSIGKNEELSETKNDKIPLIDTKAESPSLVKPQSPPSSSTSIVAEPPDVPLDVHEVVSVEKPNESDISFEPLTESYNNEFNLDENNVNKSQSLSQVEVDGIPLSDTKDASPSPAKPYSPPSSTPYIIDKEPSSVPADLPEDVLEDVSIEELNESDISVKSATESYKKNEFSFEENDLAENEELNQVEGGKVPFVEDKEESSTSFKPPPPYSPPSSSPYIIDEPTDLNPADLRKDVQEQSVIFEELDASDISSQSLTEEYNSNEFSFEEDHLNKSEELDQVKSDEMPLFDTKAEILSSVKPPPPYSPTSSSSFTTSKLPRNTCTENQVHQVIYDHINYIWDSWMNSSTLPQDYESFSSKFSTQEAGDEGDATENVYESLISDVICECIQKTLQVPLNSTMDKPYLNKIRPGPLSLKAQKLKLPRTKEKLFHIIYDEVLTSLPPGVVIYPPDIMPKPEKRCNKWVSRQRDLADEVLAQEQIVEDREWLDCWPEEVVVMDRLSETIIKRLLSEVVSNFQVALS